MSAAIQTLNNLKQAITNAFEKAQENGLLSREAQIQNGMSSMENHHTSPPPLLQAMISRSLLQTVKDITRKRLSS